MIDKIDIIKCYKLLSPYYELNPIICGSSALFLYDKLDRYPKDIDVVFMMSKAEFINFIKLNNIIKPLFECKVDWHFNEDGYVNDYIELEIEGIKLKVQKYDSIIYYMKDFVDHKYNRKWIKHYRDLKYLI